MPAQACLCIYAKGRAILGAPALRTWVGKLKRLLNPWELSLPTQMAHTFYLHNIACAEEVGHVSLNVMRD